MNWIQFRSVCRQYKALEGQNSAHPKINPQLGHSEPPSRLAYTLHERLTQLSPKERITAAGLYSQLPLYRSLQESTQFKRAFLYMAYVSFVFFVTLAIYQAKVQPQVESMMLMLLEEDWNASDYAVYRVLTPSLSIFIFAYLLLAFWIAYTLRKLQRFELDASRSWVFRTLLFPSIRRHYRHVLDLLYYPILSSEARGQTNNWITEHLCALDRDGYPIHEEINDILLLETQSLNYRCEQQMRWMAAALGIYLVISIALFLVSVYSPIFMTGNIL
jgi:hypothetical protein